MIPLTIHLFGPFEAFVDGKPLPHLRSRKGAWLLALLTLRHSRPVERVWLAGVLWPESGESQGLASLRKSLADLRSALGHESRRLQSPTPHSLLLDLTGATVDVVDFDHYLARGDSASLDEAVSLYRGPLLEDWLEEWGLPERARLEEAYLRALEQLAAQALARGQPEAAAYYLRRAVANDPLRENAQRELMRTLFHAGEPAAATELYRELRLRLHRELRSEPAPETTALFHEIRAATRGQATAADSPSVPHSSSRDGPPLRVPRPLTEFIGRKNELAEVAGRLTLSRLVTLTGAGGVGKTRLAIEVAGCVVEQYTHGAWFIDLGSLTDPHLVPQAVASALRVREESDRSVEAILEDFLRPQQRLLILDNCEHLLTACADLAASLLSGCPQLRILATSRQALGITGEIVWRVPSLSTPDGEMEFAAVDTEATSALSKYEGVQLFLQRAAAGSSFTLTSANAAVVAQVCRRLDGVPLALELAAARLKVLSVEQIAMRLDYCFALLNVGSRTALPRHQTLRATLTWSFALLTDAERILLRRISVFARSFTLEQVEAVCADMEATDGVLECWSTEDSHRTPEVRRTPVLDLMGELVDKSLVMVVNPELTSPSEVRYRLLEITRQYAYESLSASGEAASVRQRHGLYFLRLAEHVDPVGCGEEYRQSLNRVAASRDDIRAALEWFTRPSIPGVELEYGLRLAVGLFYFLRDRGYISEAIYWIEKALAAGEAQADPAPSAARAAALVAASHPMSFAKNELRRNCLERAHAIYRQIGDLQGAGEALLGLSRLDCSGGDFESARRLTEQSLAIYQEAGNLPRVAECLNALGQTAHHACDLETARRFHERALMVARGAGGDSVVPSSLTHLGLVTCDQGDYATARALHAECLAINQARETTAGTAWCLDNLGDVALMAGDLEEARTRYTESLRLSREIGLYPCISECVRGMAGVIAAFEFSDSVRKAAVLYGAAEALRERYGPTLPPQWRPDNERRIATVIARLDERTFAAAWAEGKVMTLDQAIDYALEDASDSPAIAA